MNTGVTIVEVISRTLVELACIGAGLKLLLAVAPRFQIAAPKAPVRPGRDTEAPKVPAAAESGDGGHLLVARVS